MMMDEDRRAALERATQKVQAELAKQRQVLKDIHRQERERIEAKLRARRLHCSDGRIFNDCAHAAREFGCAQGVIWNAMRYGRVFRRKFTFWREGGSPPTPRRQGNPGTPVISSLGERWDRIELAVKDLGLTRRQIEHAMNVHKIVKGRILLRDVDVEKRLAA